LEAVGANTELRNGKVHKFSLSSNIVRVNKSRRMEWAGRVTRVYDMSWATGWTIGVLWFDSQRGLGIFLFAASRTALGLTQPPIQWVLGALSLGVKPPGCEAHHSPPSNAEVKECMELYLHPPIFLHGVVLRLKKEDRDNLI
jgi:hypothetical protein